MSPLPASRHAPTAAAGFGLLEALIVSALFALALLFFVQSTLSSMRCGREQARRTAVLQLTREFVERLKADEDWATLYARLRALENEAIVATTDFAVLSGGRKALPLEYYYADLQVPPDLSDAAVLVEIPSSPAAGQSEGTFILREDVASAVWGLPGDLNGDGEIDSSARDADYVALPVRITFRWQSWDRGVQEVVRLLWLGGYR